MWPLAKSKCNDLQSQFMNVIVYDLIELWIFRLCFQMVSLGISMRGVITNHYLAISINKFGLFWLEATASGCSWGQRHSWSLRESIHGRMPPYLLVVRAHKIYYVTKSVQTQDNMVTISITFYISISEYIMWPFSR